MSIAMPPTSVPKNLLGSSLGIKLIPSVSEDLANFRLISFAKLLKRGPPLSFLIEPKIMKIVVVVQKPKELIDPHLNRVSI